MKDSQWPSTGTSIVSQQLQPQVGAHQEQSRRSSSSRRPRQPLVKKMLSPISFLWCLLSILCAGVSFFCFLQPFWIVEPRRPHCLGVFSFCVNAIDLPHLRRQNSGEDGGTVCGVYSGGFSFANLPSDAWRATCVLFGGGCLLQSLCALVAVAALFLRPGADRLAARVAGCVQGVAVLLCIGGLLTYPVGFGSPVVRHFCHRQSAPSGVFRTGICELGWSYLLAAMVTSLALFCPILASLYDIHVCLQLADSSAGEGSPTSGFYSDTERSVERISHRPSIVSTSNKQPPGAASSAVPAAPRGRGTFGNKHSNNNNNWSPLSSHSHSQSQLHSHQQSSNSHSHSHSVTGAPVAHL